MRRKGMKNSISYNIPNCIAQKKIYMCRIDIKLREVRILWEWMIMKNDQYSKISN